MLAVCVEVHAGACNRVVAGCRLLLLVPVPAVPVLLQLVVSEIIHLR